MNEPIRVLHVVTVMNLGGIENFLMTIYRKINKEKVQFDFLVLRQERGFFDDEIESLGGNIFRFNSFHPLKYFQFRADFTSFLGNHKEYRVVHSHLNANSTIILRLAKKANIPVRIAHAHIDKTGGRNVFLKNILKGFLTRYSTQNFACSEKAGKWLFGLKDFVVLHYRIDIEKFTYRTVEFRNNLRLDLNLGNNDIVIGNVARFSYQKNHKFLIKVFSRFLEYNQDAKLLLVGDGELWEKVKSQVYELGLSKNVVFVGAVKNSNDYLNVMDVLLFPSFYEGLPVALVESQCNGLPILMSDSITSEIEITDLIVRKSLKSSEEEWAQELNRVLLKFVNNDRSTYSKSTIKDRFSVESAIDYIERNYLEEYRKNER